MMSSNGHVCEQTTHLTAHEVVNFDIFKLRNSLHELEVWTVSREDGLKEREGREGSCGGVECGVVLCSIVVLWCVVVVLCCILLHCVELYCGVVLSCCINVV